MSDHLASDILPPPSPSPSSPPSTGVYELILALHTEILETIDTTLTWEELQQPSVNFSFVRPIIEKFAPKEEKSGSEEARASLGAVLYACMANRIQFGELADNDLSYKPLQETRAEFCELLASEYQACVGMDTGVGEGVHVFVREHGRAGWSPRCGHLPPLKSSLDHLTTPSLLVG